MRDALPDFVNRQMDVARSAEIKAHLAACPECAAEAELLRLIVESAPSSPRIDIARIARALPTPTRHGFLLHRGGGAGDGALSTTRIESSSTTHRRIWSRPSIRIAAAVAVVAAGGLSLVVGRDVLRPEVPVGQTRAAVAPPRAVAPAPVRVAATTDSPPRLPAPTRRPRQVAAARPAGLSLAGDLQELSDEHLATLLSELDRMEGLPAEEPEALEPKVERVDSGGANQ